MTGQYAMQTNYFSSADADAVRMLDALAALKLAAGRNPNANGQVSPYQLIAADVNGDHKVTPADALTILKMAVGRLDAPAPEWRFVNENQDFWNDPVNGVQSLNISRDKVTYDQVLLVDAQGPTTTNLVGVLTGDVTGDWKAPAGSQVMPLSYFDDLASKMGAPVAQWIL